MATNKVVVAGSDVTASQLKDFFRQIEDGSINGGILQAVLDHRDPKETPIVARPVLVPLGDAEAQLAEWRALYQEYGTELGEISIPARQAGFDRLIVVAAGLTNNQVYDWCKAKFGCWRYQADLDSITHGRDTTKSYAIWIRERVEADEENKNLSANQLKKKKVNGITLLERLLYELKYFAETGKHLDISNWTLCSGSRHSDGLVPDVDWHSVDRKMSVRWYYPDSAHDSLRARSVVSLPA